MKRIDDAPDEAYWKIALVGPGGTGKTSMGVSAPQPIIALSERQGLPSVKQAAKRLGRPVPPVMLMEEAADYRHLLRALHGAKGKPFVVLDGNGEVCMELPVEQWPKTVVVDSLSDACDLLIKEIRKQAPPKKGGDGLPQDAGRFWGVLIDRATGIIKGFRELPMHVVFLCHVSDRTKEDRNGNIIERTVSPKLATRDMANSLCAAVNVMAYTYRRLDNQKDVVWGAQTVAPEGWLTKPCEPLRKREVPDLSSWIERLSGNLDEVPEMPLPPESLIGLEEPQEGEVPEEAPPDEATPQHQCAGNQPRGGCLNRVFEEGQLCESCEHEAFSKPTPEDEAKDKEAPAMAPCLRCGRRMSRAAYAGGTRRLCENGRDEGAECVPQEATS